MTFPVARKMVTGTYAIDNGDQAPLLDRCPCCGQTLDEASADKVLKAITNGVITFGKALEQAMWQRAIATLVEKPAEPSERRVTEQ